MKTIAMAAAAALIVGGATLSMGKARADTDEICGPIECVNQLSSPGHGVCHMLKDEYYSRGMVVRGLMRATGLRDSAQSEVEETVDDVIDANCPEARRLVYFNNH